MVIIRAVDAYWAQVIGLRGNIVKSLDDFMAVRVQGAFWSPAVRSGKWDGKKHFMTKLMRFPRFFAEQVQKFLADNGVPCSIEMEPVPTLPESIIETLDLPSDKQLRDYQLTCLRQCIASGHGVIQSPTASGKTAVIASLVKLYDKKTLILVNRKSLAEQIKDRLHVFGVKDVDIVHSENRDFQNRKVCVCLVQSSDQIAEHLAEYEMLIVDEVHFAKSKGYIDIIKKCRLALNRFGFSATLPDEKTVDGLTIFANFSKKCYNLSVQDLLNREDKVVADPIFLQIINDKPPVYTKDAKPPESANTYVDMENHCYVFNAYRNTLIAYIAKKYTDLGNKVLILVRRQDHGEVLSGMVDNNGGACEYMNGAMSIEDRKEMIRRFENGEDKVLLAQTEILGVGIDIHGGCDVFIVASGGKGDISIIQRVGRAMRANEKMQVIVFDFMDKIPNFAMAKEHSQARQSIYKNTYDESRVHSMAIDADGKIYEAVKKACEE